MPDIYFKEIANVGYNLVAKLNNAFRKMITFTPGKMDVNVKLEAKGDLTANKGTVDLRTSSGRGVVIPTTQASDQLGGTIYYDESDSSLNIYNSTDGEYGKVGQTVDFITMGTHTTGNYVATITGTTNEVEVSGSGSETAAVTIGLPDDVTIPGGIEVGANTTNKWADGFHGNSDGIVLVPADFTLANASWSFSRGYFIYIDSTDGSEVLVNDADVNFICQKIIPKGFTATGTTLYGDSWSGVSALTAFGGDVTDETATQLFNGAKVPTANNSFDGAVVGGADSVVSGGKQYVTLIVNPAATADTIHGGIIHIERTPA